MHFLDWLLDLLLSWLVFSLLIAALLLRALSAIIARRPDNLPEGVRIASGAHWVDIREGEFLWSFLSLYRLVVGLFYLAVFVVILASFTKMVSQGIVEGDHRSDGFLVLRALIFFALFLSLPSAVLLWFLVRDLSVGQVFVDGEAGQITVRWGLVVLFTTRQRPLADFTMVTVYRQMRGILTAPPFRVRLEGIGKPLEVNRWGKYDHQQAYELARQIGSVARIPVRDLG